MPWRVAGQSGGGEVRFSGGLLGKACRSVVLGGGVGEADGSRTNLCFYDGLAWLGHRRRRRRMDLDGGELDLNLNLAYSAVGNLS